MLKKGVMTERMNFQAVYCRLFSMKLKVTAALTIGGGPFMVVKVGFLKRWHVKQSQVELF